MSSDVALRVRELSKRYTIQHKDHDHVTLAQAALHRLRHPRGAANREEFWALRDVSFEVPRGEVLGIIGHNGAGKSTMLKILSRITPPSAGRVEVFGRIGSLLEVGTGFHPELTGRENIYLNGSILGMKSREIDRQFDAIVEFSGVQKFLDTPVKRFSSGMYVRLAFAVAAHLDTELLLLDEALAVGDPDFQQRSVAQIKKLARDGRTVLFVSHNRDLVADLTTSAIALERGRLVDSGPTNEVLDRQYRTASREAGFVRSRGFGVAHRFTSAHAWAERRSSDGVVVHATFEAESDRGCGAWRPNFTLRSASGVAVGCSFGPVSPGIAAGGQGRAQLVSSVVPLAPGAYSLDISMSIGDEDSVGLDMVDLVSDACVFTVPELQEGAWPAAWGFLKIETSDAMPHEVALSPEGVMVGGES